MRALAHPALLRPHADGLATARPAEAAERPDPDGRRPGASIAPTGATASIGATSRYPDVG
jgi:hypothetical protein